MPLALVSQTVRVLTAGGVGGGAVHRVRTVLVVSVSGTLSVDEHVRVGCRAPAEWTALGDVLIAPGAGARRAARLSGSCPGALMVAVHHGNRCWLRPGPSGPVSVFEARGPGQPHATWDRIASLAHSCLVAGLPAVDLGPALAILEPTLARLGPAHAAAGPAVVPVVSAVAVVGSADTARGSVVAAVSSADAAAGSADAEVGSAGAAECAVVQDPGWAGGQFPSAYCSGSSRFSGSRRRRTASAPAERDRPAEE
ncbi:hypothetical protein ACGH7X_30660 [Streptomyces sp. BBFR51]|uniref:hypothetical protein n=1 Tax=Streptomyces sp. BBFR51 TaxID=3372856 RepID=UPI0037DC201B